MTRPVIPCIPEGGPQHGNVLLVDLPKHGDVLINNPKRGNALIIEDIQTACITLKDYGFECDRITHNELMSGPGELYNSKLRSGHYNLLWIATPSDWYVRTPGKRGNPHWQRVISFVKQGHVVGITVIVFGPPGFLWTAELQRNNV